MSQIQTTDTVHPVFHRANPQLVTLSIVGVVSLVAAIILAVVSNSISVDSGIYFDSADATLKLGLGAWADILLLVGVVSIVGAIVIGGALEVGKRVVDAVAPRQAPETPAD